MQHDAVKIRRGKRTDFPALTALLPSPAPSETSKAQARHWRRLASNPTHDFYVAEQAGTIRGMVLVSYIRGLTYHGWHAILDVAASTPTAGEVSRQLVEFAKTRARQRGCRQLSVCIGNRENAACMDVMSQGGFLRVGEMLSYSL